MYGNIRPNELGAEMVVIILVGLIASGKSTFAEALQRYIPQIRRCNQDELGDRHRVEDLCRTCLRQGLSVCIDRTNLDATQRSHWIGIAREFPGTAVWVIVFDTPYEVCAARLRTRRNHPTITDANHGMRILSRFASTLDPPQPGEYDKLITLTLAQQPPAGYSRKDVRDILRRLRNSPSLHVNARGTQQGTIQSPWNHVGGNSGYLPGNGHSRRRDTWDSRRGATWRAFPRGNRNE